MGVKAFFYRELLYYPVARLQAGPVKRHLRRLTRTQHLGREAIRELQRERLARLLAHARAHVPFYAEHGLADASPERMDSLPCLRKSDLQASGNRLRSTAAGGRLVAKTTGGSTGEPVTLYKTRAAMAWELAAAWRGYAWAGILPGHRQARFWGVPQTPGARRRARLIDAVCNRIRISAFSFREEDLRGYLTLLNRTRPDWFYGYVSMLAEFARFLQAQGRRLEFPLRGIVTTSEVLGDADRTLLADTFGAPVFNEYGSGELGSVAHECERGSLHLTEENMIVEVLDGNRSCADGETGELVVTELNNTGFPLIRYRTGDFGSVTDTPCPCGRGLRVLQGIRGRAYDFIRSRGGMKFHGEFIMYIFEDLRRQGARIRQFQVIQRNLDDFLVRIVPEADYDASCEALVTGRIRDLVDAEARVTFEHVDAIERERSGKLRLIKGLG